MLSHHCMICGKGLTDPASMARWIGPECASTSTLQVPFLIAAAEKAAAQRRRSKAQEEKETSDRERLLRAWKKFHREQLEQALDGMSGDIMRGLMAQLKDLRSARELVDFIAARDWSRVDANTRMVALHEINVAITKLRECLNPEEPINDALPGKPLNAFQLIKQIISPVSRVSGGANSEVVSE
jgi:hypothetical protein